MKPKLSIALATVFAISSLAAAQMKPATPLPMGQTLNFLMDKNESKDLLVSFAKGSFYLQADLRLPDGVSSNIQMQVDLLKSNGVMVKTYVLSANDIHAVSRVANTITIATAGSYRLRLKNGGAPLEYWLRIFPAAQKKFVDFPHGNEELKPLAIGAENGKGGVFGKKNGADPWWAYHKITLQPGKYNVSLYMSQLDEKLRTNLQGQLKILDPFGVEVSGWNIFLNEIDFEARNEKVLVVVKPTLYIFKVWNENGSSGANYIVGIEKA